MIGIRYGYWCVRVTHRATGLTVTLWRSPGQPPVGRVVPALRADALRLLRARLWQQRHRVGPQPLVRSYDLTGDDREAMLEFLDGELPGGSR